MHVADVFGGTWGGTRSRSRDGTWGCTRGSTRGGTKDGTWGGRGDTRWSALHKWSSSILHL